MGTSFLRRLNRSWNLSGRRVKFLLGCLGILAIEAATMASLPMTSLLAPPTAAAAPLSTLNAIQIENEQPGDATWDNFSSNLNEQMLSGYGSQTSIDRGQSINFYVTTT